MFSLVSIRITNGFKHLQHILTLFGKCRNIPFSHTLTFYVLYSLPKEQRKTTAVDNETYINFIFYATFPTAWGDRQLPTCRVLATTTDRERERESCLSLYFWLGKTPPLTLSMQSQSSQTAGCCGSWTINIILCYLSLYLHFWATAQPGSSGAAWLFVAVWIGLREDLSQPKVQSKMTAVENGIHSCVSI